MKREIFTIAGGKMLYWRLGNMNSNKQTHWGIPMCRQPPTKRGIWCFPYPHYDLFFCWHQWEQHLPRKFRQVGAIGVTGTAPFDYEHASIEERQAYDTERERLIKKIRHEFRPTTFWYRGEFYSHVSKNNETNESAWFLWDNATEWARVARKHLYSTKRIGEHLYHRKCAVDILEIFIADYA
jgi:hypothetical protein